MKEVIISAELIEKYSKPKLERWNRLSINQQRNYRKPRLNPICVGCGKYLVSGEVVYEFRSLTYTHTSLECVKSINKYVMTKELKALL